MMGTGMDPRGEVSGSGTRERGESTASASETSATTSIFHSAKKPPSSSSSVSDGEGKEAEEKAEQARIRHPKVKTGCVTCRKRRVKCDETHPHCMRCKKYGTECEGYLPGRRRPPSSTYGSFASSARPIVPRSQHDLMKLDAKPGAIFIEPFMSLFDTEQEHRYFSLFSNRIATEICPYFDPGNWSRMILQACTIHPSIRHAAIAIGALGKTYEIAQLGKSPATGERYVISIEAASPEGKMRVRRQSSEELVQQAYAHHRAALEQYDKAIKRMRNDIESGNQSLRTTLIICIVIVCFEAIHGNHMSAAGQLQSGLALVQSWMAGQDQSESHPQGFSSPVPDMVEDFLVQIFGRMEIQSMSVFDPRPPEVHTILKHEGKEAIAKMPSQFSTIEQARVYLDLITRRLMHFNASIHVDRTCKLPASAMGKAASIPPFPQPMANGNIPVTAPMPWIDGKIPLEKTQSTLSSPEVIREQSLLNQELTAWTEAFKPLLTYSVSLNNLESISALALNISSITSKISLRAAFFINESAYDVCIPEYKKIVEAAAHLLQLQRSMDLQKHTRIDNDASDVDGKGPMLYFAFDIGVVPPLYLVGIKCRDRRLRREALRLLEQNPRREGVWDSVATVALASWVMNLEEEGTRRFYSSSSSAAGSPLDGDDRRRTPEIRLDEDIPIPEEMRVRKAKMRFDLLARRANMSCLQMDVEKRQFVEKMNVHFW